MIVGLIFFIGGLFKQLTEKMALAQLWLLENLLLKVYYFQDKSDINLSKKLFLTKQRNYQHRQIFYRFL